MAEVPTRLSGVAAPELDEPGGAGGTAAMRRLATGRELQCELEGSRTHG